MKKLDVVILDIKMGNVFSVIQACHKVDLDVKVSALDHDLENADGIIIPGVGAFGTAMDYLNKNNLTEKIKKIAAKGKPIFGICLGMQLLLSESEEFGQNTGLNLVPGKVKPFPKLDSQGGRLRTPLISWRPIETCENVAEKKMQIFKSFKKGEYVYFVHSYFCDVTNKSMVSSKTSYGGHQYASSITHENLFATQFHPEKSAEKGIEIYKNWANFLKNS